MNKTQLLTHLSSLPFVAWVGTPIEILSEVKPGSNTKLYRVPYAERMGHTGRFIEVDFYVRNEGLGNELALYAEKAPLPRSRPSAMREWFLDTISANPDNYPGATVVWYSDEFEQMIYSLLVAGVPKFYYIKRNGGAPTEITGTAAEKTFYLTCLQASRFQV